MVTRTCHKVTLYVHCVFLLLVFDAFLEPNRRFIFKMNSDIRDGRTITNIKMVQRFPSREAVQGTCMCTHAHGPLMEGTGRKNYRSRLSSKRNGVIRTEPASWITYEIYLAAANQTQTQALAGTLLAKYIHSVPITLHTKLHTHIQYPSHCKPSYIHTFSTHHTAHQVNGYRLFITLLLHVSGRNGPSNGTSLTYIDRNRFCGLMYVKRLKKVTSTDVSGSN
jgi:hypothetical protein